MKAEKTNKLVDLGYILYTTIVLESTEQPVCPGAVHGAELSVSNLINGLIPLPFNLSCLLTGTITHSS